MFEKASRLKLRFSTTKGQLSAEDMWDLTLTQLNKIAVALNKQIKDTTEESFLDSDTATDPLLRLRFNIVLHILKTKQSERKDRADDAIRKAKREKILEVMARKKDSALEGMTEEELKKELDAL